MNVKQRHRIAAREVGEFLELVRRHEPELLKEFPRPLEDLAPLAAGHVALHLEPAPLVTSELVIRMLRDKYNMRVGDHQGQSRTYYGYLACSRADAVVFYSQKFGSECARFTVGHELGHLYREHLRTLGNVEQMSFLEVDAAPFIKCDDTDRRPARANDFAEKCANYFAAELIAPYKKVGEILAGMEDRHDRVLRVSEYFALSWRAASIRVDELYEVDEGQPSFDFSGFQQ